MPRLSLCRFSVPLLLRPLAGDDIGDRLCRDGTGRFRQCPLEIGVQRRAHSPLPAVLRRLPPEAAKLHHVHDDSRQIREDLALFGVEPSPDPAIENAHGPERIERDDFRLGGTLHF